jgi:gliding motility-associated-like protein
VVQLDWNASSSKDVNGYQVERSTDNKSWRIINPLVIGLTYNDSNLNTYGQPYYYRIRPVDSCGNLGRDYSITHETIHLKAVAGDQQVTLHWNRYLGWTVKSYNIYRDGKLFASASKDSARYIDTLATCTRTYHYSIEAISDSSVAITAMSNEDSARPWDDISPDRVYVRSASVDADTGKAVLTWDPVKAFDIKNYYIYRKRALDGRMILLDSTDKTIYYEDLSRISGADCYYVFAHDHCGNISAGSNRACLIILKGQNTRDHNLLNWNAYHEWPDSVKEYRVYKNEDKNGWLFTGKGKSNLTFDDGNLSNDVVDYCYQVEAVENDGKHNATSKSTVVCLHQDPYVYIPDAFTPRTTIGINDTFAPKGMFIKNYRMDIYNRWGEVVFHTNDSKSWDGTFEGAVVPSNVYMYIIAVEGYNGTIVTYKGNMMVVY